MTYPFLSGRLYGRPLLVTPERARELADYLQWREARARVGPAPHGEPFSFQARSGNGTVGDDEPPPYETVGRIAVVRIFGTLVQRSGWMDAWSGLMGYDRIRNALDTALSDPAVDGILLEVDSPGGEVAGCFDLADFIQGANAIKPIWAHAHDMAASAAYALAASASVLTASQTGSVGSVGVVMMHRDVSRAMDEKGITVTLLHAGARKVDGNPWTPLPDDVAQRVREDLETVRQAFVEKVTRGRAGLSRETVLETEAALLGAQEARALGLIDSIMPLDAALATFAAVLQPR